MHSEHATDADTARVEVLEDGRVAASIDLPVGCRRRSCSTESCGRGARTTRSSTTYRSRDQLVAALERLHDREIAPAIARGLAATVYTQLADVEEEVNGLVTYDRRFVKVPEVLMRAINDRLRDASSSRLLSERRRDEARKDSA